jgi:hypothetical protein
MSDLFLSHLQLSFLIISGFVLAAFVFVLFKKLCEIHEKISPEDRINSDSISYSEKRRTGRIRGAAVLELRDESGKRVMGTATLKDMSARGACFDSAVILKRRQMIQMNMRAPKNGGMLNLKAQVVWERAGTHSRLYGIQFTGA